MIRRTSDSRAGVAIMEILARLERNATAIAVAAILLGAAAAGTIAWQQEPFPHAAHARLFPLCEGCHAGIGTGVAADMFPTPAQCASCHDGVRLSRVPWSGRRSPVTNLVYSHVEHDRTSRAAGDSLACASCHTRPGEDRMSVRRPDPDSCRSCHAHEASDHFAQGRDCTVCHRPLAATAWDEQRIAALPRPGRHVQDGFLLDHAPKTPVEQSSCATCHARESCTRCHIDASLPAIAALPNDARIAALARGRAPSYPEPASHRAGSWKDGHAGPARSDIATCANCHTRTSCSTCHRDRLPDVVDRLPATNPGDPRGVVLQAASARVHDPGFQKTHGFEAAALESTCQSCHATSFCESCHTAPASPVFHPPDFIARHAPAAYASQSDCASCHNPEVFCRACHAGQGMVSKGRLGVAFHTANPFWIVGHGAAARQGLEGCASCHTQSSCTQCHSARLGWRISPHGPGFDAERLRQANPLTCRLCHPGGAQP